MKHTIKILLALCVAGFTGNAYAQNSSHATGTASATIVKGISITAAEEGLNFGAIVSTAGGGSIGEYGGTDTYTSDAGSDPGPSNRGTISDQFFYVTGEPNYYYSATRTSTIIVTGVNNNANTMSVTLHGPGSAGALQLDGSGNGTWRVWGSLTVGSHQAPDTYQGTWLETVTYN